MAPCQGHLEGFCLGRHGASFSQLGPVVAEREDAAVAVCRGALDAWAGRAIVIDVPVSEEAFLARLRGEGFVVQRPFTRMSYGERLADRGLSGPARTYAICGPEFG